MTNAVIVRSSLTLSVASHNGARLLVEDGPSPVTIAMPPSLGLSAPFSCTIVNLSSQDVAIDPSVAMPGDPNVLPAFGHSVWITSSVTAAGTIRFSGAVIGPRSSQSALNVTTRSPGVLDDGSRGYVAGATPGSSSGASLWLDQQSNQHWYCSANVAGAARWQPVSSAALPGDLVATQALYGMRRMRVAYAGPCFNVNVFGATGIDVGFLSDGSCDFATYDAFMASNPTARVSTWYDQSGNAYHATNAGAAGAADTRPTVAASARIGNTRSMVFDCIQTTDVTKILTLPAALALQLKYTAASCLFRVAANIQDTRVFTLGSGAKYIAVRTPVSSDPRAFWSNSGSGVYVSQGGFAQTPQLVQWTAIGTTSAFDVSLGATHFTTASISNNSVTGGFIGTDVGNGQTYGIELASLVVAGGVSTPVPATTMAALAIAQHQLYGVPQQVRGTLLIDGDSISQGIGSVLHQNRPRKTERQLRRPINVYTRARSGFRMDQQLADLLPQLPNLYDPAGPNWVSLLAGTNDIGQGTVTTGAALLSVFARYAAVARSSGFRVAVGTVLPAAGWTVAQQQVAADYNTALRNSPTLYDALVDYAGDPILGNFAYSGNPMYYYQSGIHPNDTGYDYMAQIEADALDRAIFGLG